jgi:Tfp pilus assembly protein PilO
MSEGRKALFLVLLFALIIGGWSVYYHSLYDKEMEKLANDFFNDQQMIRQLEMQIVKEQKDRDAIEAEYYLIIPKKSDIANLHQYIYDTAKKNKIDLDPVSIHVITQEITDDISSIEIGFSVDGKYLDVRSFLQEFYNSKRFLKLKNWTWDGRSEDRLTMSLEYLAYFYPNDNEQFMDVPDLDIYQPADRVNPL